MEFNIENRRYIGSKAKLSEWIISLIKENCQGNSFAEIFAGTGIISARSLDFFDELILNDFLYSNYAIYQAFFGEGKWDKNKLISIINNYNNIDSKKLKSNYFSKNFGNKYFSKDNAKLIGFIREDIENIKNKLTKKEYYILLTSLIYSFDKIANTVGHYDAFFKNKVRPEILTLNLINPLSIKNKKINIFREDTNKLVHDLNVDTVYIDPPYNSRQYSRFYHVLETLVKWDKPKLYGVALKPKPENMSKYCKVSAFNAFEDLIENLNCKNIIVSYNNTYNSKSHSSKNKISLNQIKEVLNKKGKTQIFEKKHKFFNSGKTHFDNHKEFIFITEVNQK